MPLSAEEIERACAIVQESPEVPDGVRFVWAAVAEGAKGAESDVRLAEVLAYDRPTGYVAPRRRRSRRGRGRRATSSATTCSRR